MRIILFLIIHSLLSVIVHEALGQKFQAAVPYSVSGNLVPVTLFERIIRNEETILKKNDLSNSSGRLKDKQFAEMIEVDYNPMNAGQWDNTTQGRVWRLGVVSHGAHSLYEIFGRFRLADDVRLFVYTPDKSGYAGAFTSKNNNSQDVLSLAPIPGESIIIELNIPYEVDDFGELSLTKIGHGLIAGLTDDYLKSYGFASSGSCNVDVNCFQGKGWQKEKDAVVRMLVDGLLCTGTLINSITSAPGPMLITACHCIDNSASAANALFFFDHERPFCDVNEHVRSYSISGSELIATTNRELDFSLVLLSEIPPVGFSPYLAGWNVGNDIPGGGASIHHPQGDVKKISIEKDALEIDDFGEGFNQNSHWLVKRWETGTTEGGSSGAPFFDNDGRLRGTLTGGDATCRNPVNDFFSRIDLAWDFYSEPHRQLKYWLDPHNNGMQKIDGRYYYDIDRQEKVYSNTTGEFTAVYKNNLDWGVISGHNSAGYSMFAERFQASSSMNLTGMYIDVRDRFYSDVFSTFKLKVWQGSEIPEEEIYSQEVYIRSVINNTDNYFYFDSLINVSGNFFVGFSIDYALSDTVMVYTAENRGSKGLSLMYVYDGVWHNISEVTNPPINTSLSLGIISYDLVNPAFLKEKPLKITPNPGRDWIMVEFSYDIPEYSVNCYDVSGRLVSVSYTTMPYGFVMDTSRLGQGHYFLDVNVHGKRKTGRFMIKR